MGLGLMVVGALSQYVFGEAQIRLSLAAVAALTPLVRANARDDPETLVRLLKLETNLAFDEGRYDDIEKPAREALELATRTLGVRHPLTVMVSSLLAEKFVITGPADEALRESERGLDFALAAYGSRSGHPHVIRIREVRSRALAMAGRFHEAIAEADKVIEAARTAFGPRSAMAAYAMINIAPYDRRVGALRRSLERTNVGLEMLAERIDPRSRDYAVSLTTRAATLLEARRPAEALDDLTKAEGVMREILGESHWDTITARFNRAVALAYLRRFAEAEQALAPAREPAFTPAFPWWVAYMEGIVARLAGDYGRAAERLREAERLITAPGPRGASDRARTFAKLGPALLELGDLDAAKQTLLQARALFEQLAVEMHPAYADVMVALGRIEMSRGNLDRALSLLVPADAFWREFDPTNRFAGEAAFWLGRCYAALGSDAAAAEAFERARRVLAVSHDAAARRLLSEMPTGIRQPAE